MNMKKVLEMKAKREDARLKAMAILNRAEAEDRFLSEEEQQEIDKYEGEIRAWDADIGRAGSRRERRGKARNQARAR